jgi:hypothetical protein
VGLQEADREQRPGDAEGTHRQGQVGPPPGVEPDHERDSRDGHQAGTGQEEIGLPAAHPDSAENGGQPGQESEVDQAPAERVQAEARQPARVRPVQQVPDPGATVSGTLVRRLPHVGAEPPEDGLGVGPPAPPQEVPG